MNTQKKKEEAKVRDLQPTKDAKGGARIDPHGPPVPPVYKGRHPEHSDHKSSGLPSEDGLKHNRFRRATARVNWHPPRRGNNPRGGLLCRMNAGRRKFRKNIQYENNSQLHINASSAHSVACPSARDSQPADVHASLSATDTDHQLVNLIDGSATATYTLTGVNGDILILSMAFQSTDVAGRVTFAGGYTVTGGSPIRRGHRERLTGRRRTLPG
jgi:hypothetical protein